MTLVTVAWVVSPVGANTGVGVGVGMGVGFALGAVIAAAAASAGGEDGCTDVASLFGTGPDREDADDGDGEDRGDTDRDVLPEASSAAQPPAGPDDMGGGHRLDGHRASGTRDWLPVEGRRIRAARELPARVELVVVQPALQAVPEEGDPMGPAVGTVFSSSNATNLAVMVSPG